ncbi:hypothetical protein HZZ00_18840 [Streptomyces sp. NEAU-sy36]|uniref:hypothetical protein n=1 Tax=unclassified Streptomyces TaxID=2593676 RepID=UPI0015D5F78A|nr:MULTISPECIES: hypothetical protein [unclassified Streptomyces]QLJ02864.1 hypothetical protein HZZ00_18840 [Streptomyces sp. NEAU-sy36]
MPDADYFSAVDDESAVAVIQAGGPVRAGLDVIFLKDTDPVDAIAQVESVMSGCSYEEASQRPRAGQLLSPEDADSPFVLTVSDTLCDVLVSASGDDLVAAAATWSAAGGVIGLDAATAAVVLEALAGLARRARAAGLRLYCWWTL